MALDAVDMLDHLKWKSGVHLVGMSMGGSVAQLVVAYHPQYFASVCFTSTMAHAYLDFVSAAGAHALSTGQRERSMRLTLLHPLGMASCAVQVESDDNQHGMGDCSKHMHHMARTQEQSKARINSQTEATLVHYFADEHFRRIRASGIPVLVCTGDSDRLMVPANSEFIAARLNAPLRVFKGCGHFISMQEPELYNSMLLDHFRKAASKAVSPMIYASL
ncbi:Alpha/Beta hydrolase protein [Syncephalis pseudoplumigaleata]|uniref:Alpha/Beta hydrolase protein n=1 Tax=Syncephalis pseudoplumigaleata TaxID=1712513 RepID=A0A4P9Z0S8_9FUNG|nr:Alpha/Beta hydrolase protein [Syncephalis pseudoplumigaleata]|eukprot:RKP25492.1 Alpha/Beta hydrolase protein [Syncephalis pseudoplumigaleata]